MAKNIGVGLLFLTAAFLSLQSAVPWIGSLVSRNSNPDVIPYICTETREVSYDVPQQEPALNPLTGRRTLVRAMYATQSQKWVPAPPEQVLRQNRQRYAAAGAPLAFEPPAEVKTP